MATVTEAIDNINAGTRARHPLQWVSTVEEGNMIDLLAETITGHVFAWSFPMGVRPVNNRAVDPDKTVFQSDSETVANGGLVGPVDPDGLFDWIYKRVSAAPEKDKAGNIIKRQETTLLLLELDEFVENDPVTRRKFREILSNPNVRKSINLIMLTPRAEIPVSLRDLAVMIEPSHGTADEHAKHIRSRLSRMNAMISANAKKHNLQATLYQMSDDEITRCANIAAGLTREAAGRAYMTAVVSGVPIENGARNLFKPLFAALSDSKREMISGLGFLQYEEPKESMSTVGGQSLLKDWLRKRVKAFGPKAREYGLSEPKGVLVVGPPGTGKSLGARAASALWGRPLVRLDVGALFGGIVGESEKNTRKAISMIEAMSPCVLWIDEIEKGLSGTGSSGGTDGGTTARVFQSLLTWLNEKSSPVFVFATANDPASLPAELLRKGRFDEIFSILLPTEAERAEILGIHLGKRNRKASDFALSKVVSVTEGFSGAELEQVVVEALYQGFDEDREINTEDMIHAAKSTRPLSQTMAERISYMQKWAEDRARPASPPPALPSVDIPAIATGYESGVTIDEFPI